MRTHRLLAAKRLIDDTALSMADVAFAAGFESVRRFNAAVRGAYGRTPSELRRAARNGGRGRSEAGGDGGDGPSLTLRLAYRPPLAWEPLLGFLAARAIPGVEQVDGDAYRRSVALPVEGTDDSDSGEARTTGGAGDGETVETTGVIEIRPQPGEPWLRLTVPPALIRALPRIVGRARRLFDLDADPAAVAERLGTDPLLAPTLAAHPGLRVPGAWDGFELAVRAVLGQQVSVRAATTLAERLVEAHGRPPAEDSAAEDSTAGRLFPRPEALTDADLGAIGLTRARAETVRRLAAAVASGEIAFDGADDAEALAARLTRLPGIGDWTAQYVAMRALGAPDAFPVTDLGLLRAAGDGSDKTTPARLGRRAEAWRPWRAYAAVCLWTTDAAR